VFTERQHAVTLWVERLEKESTESAMNEVGHLNGDPLGHQEYLDMLL